MIVRAIDASGDWTFGKGRNNYLSNNAAIEQNLATRLRSFLGDCFFALTDGLDWFNLLGSKNQLALELAVRSCILNTSGVTAIVNLSITLDAATRNINMQYTVNTIYTTAGAGDAQIIDNTSFILTESGDILTTEDGAGITAG